MLCWQGRSCMSSSCKWFMIALTNAKWYANYLPRPPVSSSIHLLPHLLFPFLRSLSEADEKCLSTPDTRDGESGKGKYSGFPPALHEWLCGEWLLLLIKQRGSILLVSLVAVSPSPASGAGINAAERQHKLQLENSRCGACLLPLKGCKIG